MIPAPANPGRAPARRRSTPSRRWPGRLLAGGVLAGVLWLAGRPLYPGFKTWRGRGHAAAATRLGKQGDLKAAADQLKLALRFAPEDAEVLRTAAEFCAAGRQARGLEYYSLLVRRGDATPGDRRRHAELALDLHRLDRAGEELAHLLKDDPQDLASIHLLVRQQRLARELDRALRTARYALAVKPEDEGSQLDLGRLLQEPRNPAEQRAEGRRLLWGLAVATGRWRDAATDLLVGDPDLNRGERELLLKSVQARPAGRLSDRLVALDLRLALAPAGSNALVAEAIRSLGKTADTTHFVKLAGWAIQHGGSDTLLEILPAAATQTNRQLVPLRALALAEAKHWNELAGLLETSRGAIDECFTATLKGRLALARGRTPEAETHFHSALQQPATPPSQLRYLARATEKAGFPLLAVQAWQRLLAEPDETLDAALQILRLVQPLDDAFTALLTLKRLNEFIPGDDFVAGERAWHELMLRQDVEFGRRTAGQLAVKYPQDLQWRFLQALAQLRSQQAGEALVRIEPEIARWDRLSPRLQAVAVVALGENNQREAARGFARKISANNLNAAERRLLAPWL